MSRIESRIVNSTFLFIQIFLLSLLVTSCRKDSIIINEDSQDEVSEYGEEDSDYIWDESDVIYITLSDNSTTSASGVSVSGDTITITSAGIYSFSGTLSEGQIIVNAADDDVVKLLFNGINIHYSANAPVYVLEAEKVIINLVEDTENFVSDGSTYSGFDDPNACIYSKTDLTIFGKGVLTVTANYNDGITSKDGLLIKGGVINVDAMDDAIRGKDYLIISDADITIEAGGDGLLSDNEEGYIKIESGEFNITADDDAIHAKYAVTINGGVFTIDANDDGIQGVNEVILENTTIIINSSSEGIEGGNITVQSGIISVTATDDGFNATQGTEVGSDDGSQLIVNDGTITVNMSGYDVDAMDSNGDITINGGTINLNIPTIGPASALDANGTITIHDDAEVYENGEVYTNSGSGSGGGH